MADVVENPDPDDIALAGEYALNLLDSEEERAVLDRMASDPSFAKLVHDWEEELAELGTDFEDVDPRLALRSAILKRVFTHEPNASRSGPRFGGWVAAACVAAVLGIGTMFFIGNTRVDQTAPASVALSSDGQAVIAKLQQPPREGYQIVLWAVDGTAQPQFIGVLTDGTTQSLRLSAAVLESGPSVRIAFSEEPITTGERTAPTAPLSEPITLELR